MTVYSSVLEMIGNTPIVDVSQLSPNPDVRILGKMEGQNPAGSVKDRIALSMITEAEADGTLSPGCTIIEPSSGNTGIAMAMICRIKGYNIKIVLPGNVSIERRQLLEVYGAEIIDSPGEEGSNGAVRMAIELADAEPRLGVPLPVRERGQPQGALPHDRARDLRATCPTSPTSWPAWAPRARCWVSGTYLKEQNPDIKILAVEPPSGEQVEGLRSLEDGYIPPVFDKWGGYDLLDGKSIVRPRESLEFTRQLADVGIFSGISAGAALAGAVKVAKQDRVRHDRVRRVRLRLEVPLHRRVDARPGRGDGERREGHLLLSVPVASTPCVTRPIGMFDSGFGGPHRRPGAHRPAARRGPGLPGRHRPVSVRPA